jgi:DNA-binding response OmpR family regulator
MRTSGSWVKSNERVLVIADSKETRDLLMGVLMPEGFIVYEQPSAIGVTRSIRQNAIRAVIIDAGIPGIRGDKLISVLRENPRLQGLIVLAVTGERDARGLVAKGLEAADAIVDRATVEQRLVPLLGTLLRGSSFHPQLAFALASTKS